MSLTDPLTLLRDYTMQKKPITLEGDVVVFGRTRFPRAAKTAYKNTGAADGTFYQIDSLWSILQGKSAGQYAVFCGQNRIPPVHLKDRKKLLEYMQGAEPDDGAIDYTQYVPVEPVSADASADASAEKPADAVASSSKPADKRPREPTAEEQAAVEAGRKAFKRLLAKGVGVGPPEEGDEGSEADTLKDVIAKAKPFIRQDREITQAIVRREVKMRDRNSNLLAPTAKSFPIIENILEGFKKRNKQMLDMQEKEARRAARKEGGGGQASGSGAAAGAPSSSSSAPPPQAKKLPATAVHPTVAAPAKAPRPVSNTALSGYAILVVPSAITAIVNMYNVKALLEDNNYETAGIIRREIESICIARPHTRTEHSSTASHAPSSSRHSQAPSRPSTPLLLHSRAQGGRRRQGDPHGRQAYLRGRLTRQLLNHRQPDRTVGRGRLVVCLLGDRPGLHVAVQGLAVPEGRDRDLLKGLRLLHTLLGRDPQSEDKGVGG